MKELNTRIFYAKQRMKGISDNRTTLTAYWSLFETQPRYGLTAKVGHKLVPQPDRLSVEYQGVCK